MKPIVSTATDNSKLDAFLNFRLKKEKKEALLARIKAKKLQSLSALFQGLSDKWIEDNPLPWERK